MGFRVRTCVVAWWYSMLKRRLNPKFLPEYLCQSCLWKQILKVRNNSLGAIGNSYPQFWWQIPNFDSDLVLVLIEQLVTFIWVVLVVSVFLQYQRHCGSMQALFVLPRIYRRMNLASPSFGERVLKIIGTRSGDSDFLRLFPHARTVKSRGGKSRDARKTTTHWPRRSTHTSSPRSLEKVSGWRDPRSKWMLRVWNSRASEFIRVRAL